MLPIEVTHIEKSLKGDRKLTIIAFDPRLNLNEKALKEEMEKRKRQTTLLIGAFVVSKVLSQEIFDNDEAIKEHFSDVPQSEKVYFHFYGMTLVTLLTDLIIRRFGTHIIV